MESIKEQQISEPAVPHSKPLYVSGKTPELKRVSVETFGPLKVLNTLPGRDQFAMKVLVLLCVVLGAFLATVEARRGGFTLPTFGPITPKPISCDSVLVKLNPSAYPHCCFPGPWRFDKTENVAKSVCPSGRRYVLVRTTCPKMHASQGVNRSICEPTIKEKAEKILKELSLGRTATGAPGAPGPVAVAKSKVTFFRKTARVLSANSTRGRRGVSVPCPSNNAEKRVCQDILKKSPVPCWRGRRSPEDIDAENEILADLIQAQEDIYTNKRTKRQTLPSTTRNVYFVVDSSGSIRTATYQRVLNVLSEFAKLLCGEASIGMVTYATVIDLEFCPTCLRSLDEVTYRTNVVNKIKAARYHNGWTGTGETVKCLSEELLPSRDCRVTTLPTQLVFFTDGRANGCTKAADAIASLETRYPLIETYAIGMGDIRSSGVSDLLSTTFNQNNIFNVNDIDELEALLKQIEALISGGQWTCAPVVVKSG